MRGPGGGLALAVLAGVLAAAAGHAGTEAGGGAGAAAVTRARCAARCLGLRLRGGPGEVGSLAQCGEHAECAKCLQPCREARELEAHECEAYCEALFPAGRGSECLTSCAFLASARRVKQGACPAPARARGFQAACVEGCAADADCAGPRRCCPNGCGRTCRDPRRPFRGVPLRPGRALRLLPRGPGRLGLRWSSRFSVSAEPVVYVVQRRAGPGPPTRPPPTPRPPRTPAPHARPPRPPRPAPRPAWATVAETTEERAELRDIRPGRWYQFRVAAVNAHGTRGFTAPSPPFRAPEDPAPPPAPSSLRLTAGASGSTVGAGSTARLAWDPPARDPDVPVHHYRVAWGPDGGERTRGTADGRRPELLLDGLRPGLLYAVELQAVAHWGPTRLRSPRARLRFRAPDPAPPEPAGKLRPPQEVGPPFLLDGRLRATVRWAEPQGLNATRFRVRWTPRACAHNRTAPTGAWAEAATRHPHLTLDGLAFSCSYQVRVLPGGPGFEFDTPACADLDPAARCGD